MIKRLILFTFLFIYKFSVFSQLYFNEVSSSVDFNHTYFQGVSGAGVSFVDFDNDGLDDISIPTNDYNVLLFFKNNGDKFSSIDLKINFPYQAKQVLWIDYDNDYDKDLYITSFNGKNKLYQNNGFMNFEDVTKKLNLPDSSSNSFGASWADINNDGFIDLFQTYRSQDSVSNVSKVFLNVSGVSFQDISTLSGINEINKLPFCATFVDIDNNNIQDLYIANDKGSGNSMYYNNGNNTFSNISISSNTGAEMDAMSVTVGDYNNDGYYDIYSTNLEDGSKMFVNNKDLTFNELANDLGISFNGHGWGAQFEDFDLDGYEDLYVSGSLVGSSVISSAFYSNIFGKYFEINNSVGLSMDTVSSYGNAVGDIDNDGSPDLVILNNSPNKSFLLKNTYAGNNNWLKVNLIGYESNADAFGARVKLYSGDFILSRSKFSTEGYISQNSNNLFFGISDNTEIDSLEIFWPSGIIDKLFSVQPNQSITIHEGSSLFPPRIYSSSNTFCSGGSMFLETGEYENYLWSNGETSKKIEIFDEGNYFVKVSDKDGNEYTSDTISIFASSPPEFDLLVKNITSSHSSSVEITNTDENRDYFVSIDNGEYKKNNFFINNLISGEHSITVRDSLGCESSKNFTILNLVKGSNNPEFTSSSIARKWIEVLLDAIRDDLARPPIHARNLFHLSSIMYDAFVIYQKVKNNNHLTPFLLNKTLNDKTFSFEFPPNVDDEEYLEKIISFSSYNLIRHRFKNSVGVVETYKRADSLMVILDYDQNYSKLDYIGGDPRSIGNYLFKLYSDYGYLDHSNEINNYSSNYYEPLNPPLDLNSYGNPDIIDPNRWQPLSVPGFIDQSGNLIEGIPEFISPEWGNVIPFVLSETDMVIKVRDDNLYKIYHDPGPPPYLDTLNQGYMDSIFKTSFSMVSVWGSHLDRNDGVIWDISPNSIGNINSYPDDFSNYHQFYNYFDGGDYGNGHEINPFTNKKYEEQLVPRGDYTRVLAEFWADGPDSETPPGHWFVILNEINDDENLIRKFEGMGEELSRLEWDIKSYFLLGGAMHDAAITAWSAKGYYDYVRPISILRYLSEKGQSTYPDSLNYNPNGYKLIDNYIEIVNLNDPLVGNSNENLGKIKLYTWKGFSEENAPIDSEKGAGWILAQEWWPYQRPSFVTPPFAGYISGHSTYSSAAATILEKLTGSNYFPGGLGEFSIEKNNFLVFEEGPSVDMKLQWATYRDAADQCALSRIWGGIHPYVDDIPGRKIGKILGRDAFEFAKKLFEPQDIVTRNNERSNSFILYPNPVNSGSQLTIYNESSLSIYRVSIISLSGQVVLSENMFDLNKKIILNLDKLPRGIYIVNITFEDGSSKSTKIIISK